MPVKKKKPPKEGGQSLQVFPRSSQRLERRLETGHQAKGKSRPFRAAFLMPNYSKFLFSYLYSEYQTRSLRETKPASYFGS
jgi:hypothetical protein